MQGPAHLQQSNQLHYRQGLHVHLGPGVELLADGGQIPTVPRLPEDPFSGWALLPQELQDLLNTQRQKELSSYITHILTLQSTTHLPTHAHRKKLDTRQGKREEKREEKIRPSGFH